MSRVLQAVLKRNVISNNKSSYSAYFWTAILTRRQRQANNAFLRATNSQKRSSLMTALVDDATTKCQHVEDSGSRLCVVQWSTSLKFWKNRRVWIRYKERDDEETSVVNWTHGSTTADSVLSIGLQDWSTDCVCSVRAGKTFDVTSAGLTRRFVQARCEEVDETRRSVQSLRTGTRQRRVWIFKINEKIIVNVMIAVIYTTVISDRWEHIFGSINDHRNEGKVEDHAPSRGCNTRQDSGCDEYGSHTRTSVEYDPRNSKSKQ